MPEPYALDQWIWTHADFERMGWHDATVHAMGYASADAWEFALDIDYILEWVQPAPGQKHFTFWVAPATLIFECVSDLRIELEPRGELSVQDVRRDHEQPARAGFHGPGSDWRWTLDCNEGEISMCATGYRQIFRRAPVHRDHQKLGLNDRGGISFSEIPPGMDVS